MKIERTKIEGVFIIYNFNTADDRGLFVKSYNKNTFKENNIDFEIRESYYSVSNKNVIRGMHFQLPPHDHDKLVYVVKGSIIDVIVDLRSKSKTFKKFFSFELSHKNKIAIFLPPGIAHGFKSLEDDTITIYNVGTEYNFEYDTGINYDSFNFDWGIDNPIVSERDKSFDNLNFFCSKNIF